MTTFVLHGGFTSAKNDLNAGFYGEFSRYVPDGATILLIYFAREDSEVEARELFKEDREKILEQTKGKRFDFLLASQDEFLEQVKRADVIYMRGGDTDKLLAALKQYPDLARAIQGKVVVGSSAGAYAISTYYYSGSKGGVYEGLGLLPIRVTCHYESKLMEREADREGIATLEKYPHNLELVALRDYEWKTIRG